MIRSTLIKKLRELEDIAIPEGHRRTNKGATTYFFSEGKRQEIESFLSAEGLTDQGQLRFYVQETKLWKSEDNSRRVLLHATNPNWVSVAVLVWPV